MTTTCSPGVQVNSLHGLSPAEMEGDWHTIQIFASRGQFGVEARYARELARRDIAFYLPTEKVRVSRGEARCIDRRPIFKGYVFAAFPECRWYDIKIPYATYGIRPAKVINQSKFAADLQRFFDGELADKLVEINPEFVKDREVEVVRGPFAGARGWIIIRKENKAGVRLELSGLGWRTYEADADDCELVPKGEETERFKSKRNGFSFDRPLSHR